MLEIIPAVLTNSAEELEMRIRQLEDSGVKRLHLDVVDGEFADNQTVSLEACAGIETQLQLDIHLMVVEPALWIERAMETSPDRIIAQIERMADQEVFVGKAIEAGVRVGLAVDLETLIERLDPMVTSEIDVVLLMGVRAGFGGQEFNRIALDKIEKLIQLRESESANFKILVDGGVDKENIQEIEETGAAGVVVGHGFEEMVKNES